MSASIRVIFRSALAGLVLASACKSAPPPGASDQPPAAAANGAAEGEVAPQASQILLLERIERFDAEGKLTTTWRHHSRVLTERGVEENSRVTARWSPWFESTPSVTARVRQPDGAVVELDQSTLSEAPASASGVYSDAKLLRAPIPAVRVGSIVESEIVVQEHRLRLDGSRYRHWAPRTGEEISVQRYVVEAPVGLTLHHRIRNLALEPVITEEGGLRRWVFEVQGTVSNASWEPNAPNDTWLWPHVAIATTSTWRGVADAYHAVVQAKLSAKAMAAIAGSARKKGGDVQALATRILAELRKRVRYEALELGEGSIVPRTPEQTLQRGYGDCKDLAVALVSGLQAEGVEAHLALLQAGPGTDVDPELPGMEQFDHVIVFVPSANLWIDATFELERPGELPLSARGRRALIVRPGSAELVDTPSPEAALATYREVREIFMSASGPSKIVETSEATGPIEHGLTYDLGGRPEKDLKKSLESYSTEVYGTSTITAARASAAGEPYRLKLELAEARAGYTDEMMAAVAIRGSQLLAWLPEWMRSADEAPKSRTRDVVLAHPYRAEIEYRIKPVSGYLPRALPPALDLSLGRARFVRAVEQQGELIVLRFAFDTGGHRYTPDEVKAYFAALPKVQEALDSLLELDDIGVAHLNAGRHREALAHLREAVAREPKSAVLRSKLAFALLKAGLGEEARVEAKRGAALDPRSSHAQFRLGWVLMHDLIGVEAGKGWDRSGSIAAYQRTKVLDESLPGVFQNLALLYERNDDAIIYGQGADLDAAIKEYRGMQALGEHGRDLQLAEALRRTGRLDEAEAVMRALDRTTQHDAMLLTLAVQRGGESALLATAQSLGLSGETRSQAFGITAQTMLRERRYPEAAAAMRAAAHGSANAVQSLATADTLARIRRSEEALPALARPAQVVVRALTHAADVLSLERPVDARLISRRLSEDLAASREDSSRVTFLGSLGAPADRELMIDMLASLGHFEADGDDRVGYRVKMTTPGDSPRIAYLVPEAGGLKLRGSNIAGFAAEEAIERAGKGDLAGARRWAEWASEGWSTAAAHLPAMAAALCRDLGKASLAAAGACGAAILVEHPLRYELALQPQIRRHGKGALSLVEKHQKTVSTPAELAALEQLRIQLLHHLGRDAEALPLARAQHASRPDDHWALAALGDTLVGLGKQEEAATLWKSRLEKTPKDARALDALTRLAAESGDHARLESVAADRAAAPDAPSRLLNTLAWHGLFSGQLAQAEARALRAAQATQFANTAILNTLAAVQAELGKTTEAMQALQRIRALQGRLLDHDWYVVGRIAEHYELTDAAKRAYAKVSRPKQPRPDDTYNLVQRRLAVLGTRAK